MKLKTLLFGIGAAMLFALAPMIAAAPASAFGNVPAQYVQPVPPSPAQLAHQRCDVTTVFERGTCPQQFGGANSTGSANGPVGSGPINTPPDDCPPKV